MEVKLPPPPDPTSNIVMMKPRKREAALKLAPKDYDACKHENVTVIEETRKVVCQNCPVELDAFTVLLQMAQRERRWIWDVEEWIARRDSMLAERYDEQWAEEQNKIRTPPTDPELLKVWRVFEAYFTKGKFVGMYGRKRRLRSGPQWYGMNSHGGYVSLEWARSQLIPKAVKPDT